MHDICGFRVPLHDTCWFRVHVHGMCVQGTCTRQLCIKGTYKRRLSVFRISVNDLLLPQSPGAVRECRGSEGGVCYVWEGDRRLHVTRQKRDNADVECYDVTWTALACVTQVLQDCYSLQEAYWYGGFEDYNQYWPLNRIQQNMAPYVTGDTWNKQYGNILERLFVSSNGFGIYVYPEVPLYLSFNESGDGRVCVAAKYEMYPYFNPTSAPPVLRYQLCQGADVKALHRHMTSVHVPRPRDIPAEDLFGGAIWSTWAMFKGPVNQTKVLHFAQQIVHSGESFCILFLSLLLFLLVIADGDDSGVCICV